jgi:hypothetical protein
MKKYLVVYKADPEAFAKVVAGMTPESRAESMKDWGAWMEKHKANIADMGAPVGKTKSVSKEGVTDIRNDIGGYTIVQAETHDEAAAVMQDSPHFAMMPGTVELMEILEM